MTILAGIGIFFIAILIFVGGYVLGIVHGQAMIIDKINEQRQAIKNPLHVINRNKGN